MELEVYTALTMSPLPHDHETNSALDTGTVLLFASLKHGPGGAQQEEPVE